MYTTLIQQVKATLESVDEVKIVYAHPEGAISKYPAVIFYPTITTNAFASSKDNAKGYSFVIFVIVGLKQITKSQAFETVMPKVVDAIFAKFDASWSYGRNANQSRVLTIVTDSQEWGIQQTEQGEVAFAPLTLLIKTLTSI